MISFKHKSLVAAVIYMLACIAFSNAAAAQSTSERSTSSPDTNVVTSPSNKNQAAAVKHVNDALTIVRQMESVPRMKSLMQQAKGVFIVPSYGRVALGVGGRGGSGVLLIKNADGSWSDPAFYNIGSFSVGLQAGAQGGSIAMVLNTDAAVDRFKKANNFSLSAGTGITVINWTKVAESSTGPGDVVVWSGTKGLFGDVVTIGINDIRFNQNLTNAYYGQMLTAQDVMSGKAQNPHANALKQELASISGAASSTGSQGGAVRSGTSESGK
jgi:lipid-binding SYLF domain-containing protein